MKGCNVDSEFSPDFELPLLHKAYVLTRLTLRQDEKC